MNSFDWGQFGQNVIGPFLLGHFYLAFALRSLAKKLQTPRRWLAWIPFGNLLLMTHLAQKRRFFPPLLLLSLFLVAVAWFAYLPILPIFLEAFLKTEWIFKLFVLVTAAALICWLVLLAIVWVSIAKRRGFPYYFGLAVVLIPYVSPFFLGMLAWISDARLQAFKAAFQKRKGV